MRAEASAARLPILLVEDDAEDVEITRRAFRKANIRNPLYVVRDGAEAMEFLRHTGRHSDGAKAPRPALVLLDLNLPRMNGRDVLAKVKGDPQLRRIPVVVLTTSAADTDVATCYDRGANSYITKPLDFGEFLRVVTTIGSYWLETVQIPDIPAGATA